VVIGLLGIDRHKIPAVGLVAGWSSGCGRRRQSNWARSANRPARSERRLPAAALTPWLRSLPRKSMSDDAPESLIPYDEIVQEALRDVVGRVLHEVEREGVLPGSHHFYITFKTRMPGVSIPKHLAERFPDEMTIVIQHRFWDLK